MPFKKKQPPAAPAGEAEPSPAVSKVASIDAAPPGAVEKLLAEINDLKSQLAVEKTARGEAEQAALDAASAQGALLQNEVHEVPTGKTVTVKRVKVGADGAGLYKVVGHHDDGRDILRPIFEDKKIPTFFYKIDLPPCGGVDLKINSVSYYHGAVYEFDEDTLRTVKEMVYRCWDHDRNIHGSDENFYRKKSANRLSARGMSA